MIKNNRIYKVDQNKFKIKKNKVRKNNNRKIV